MDGVRRSPFLCGWPMRSASRLGSCLRERGRSARADHTDAEALPFDQLDSYNELHLNETLYNRLLLCGCLVMSLPCRYMQWATIVENCTADTGPAMGVQDCSRG
jgi:hypothetical protein